MTVMQPGEIQHERVESRAALAACWSGAPTMNYNVLMLTGLFVVSYGGLLWLTAPDHRANDIADAGAVVRTVTPLTTSPSDDLPLPISRDEDMVTELRTVEDEQLTDVEVQGTNSGEPIQQPDYSTTPQAVEVAVQSLRSDSGRNVRLVAVNSLLLRGRQATVDPAILQALKDAATDADEVIAAQASSALTEVERATH